MIARTKSWWKESGGFPYHNKIRNEWLEGPVPATIENSRVQGWQIPGVHWRSK